MAENFNNCTNSSIKDKVCINTDKVYDACRQKDCLEDLRVYLTRSAQEVLITATSVKVRSAEIIWVYSDVEPVTFNKGYYSVDLRYYFKITLDIYSGNCSPYTTCGLAYFDKRIILYGSDGNSKIFTSTYVPCEHDITEQPKTNMPKSVVQVVDPIPLNAKLVEKCKCKCNCDICSVPSEICKCFNDDLVMCECEKTVLVTIGIFTIVKLERNVELLIPVYDFCIPKKECEGSTDEDPCNIFKNICFPVEQFFPPSE